jgi:hypothetical protein
MSTNSTATAATDTVLYREVQPYRELPPVILLAVVSALAGWGLLVWTVLLGRPLGALALPGWLAIVLGVGFGVVLPSAFLWVRMTTLVYPDRVVIDTGMAGRNTFAFRDVTAVEMRVKDLRQDYSNRTMGTEDNTRWAYAVNTLQGTQLTMVDGRFILVGSKKPEELTSAIDSAWGMATISS